MGRPIKKFDSSDELDLAVRYIGQDPKTWVARNPQEQLKVIELYRNDLGQGKLAKATNLIPPDLYLKKELNMDPRDVRTPIEPQAQSSVGHTRIMDVKAERDTALKGLYEESVPQWIRDKKAAAVSRYDKTNSPVMRGVYSVGARALSKLESKYTGLPEYQAKREEIISSADMKMAQIREDRIKDPSNKRMIELLEDIEENTRTGGSGSGGSGYTATEDEGGDIGNKRRGLGILKTPFAALGAGLVGGLASDKFGAKMVSSGMVLYQMYKKLTRKKKLDLGDDTPTSTKNADGSTESTKDPEKMGFVERFKNIWEGDKKEDKQGGSEGKKSSLFDSIFNMFRGGLGGIFGKISKFILPLVGAFSSLGGVLVPVLAVLGTALAAWKAGGWLSDKFLTNKDGSNKIADMAMKVTGKDDAFKPGSYDDPVVAMNAYNKAMDSGGTISQGLADAVTKLGVKVDPKRIKAFVSTASESNGSRIAQKSAALSVAEQKKEQIERKNEEQKHQDLVNAPRNVQVIAPTSVQTNNTTSSGNLSSRNPDSTLQTFLQSRMRYA